MPIHVDEIYRLVVSICNQSIKPYWDEFEGWAGYPTLPSPIPLSPSPLSLYPLSFLHSLSYSLIPPFQFNPLSHPNCLLLFPSPSPLSLLQVPSPSISLFTPSSLCFPLLPYFSFSQSFSSYNLPAPISLVLTLFSPFTNTISLFFSPYSLLPPFFSPFSHPISLLITASNSSQNLQ